MDDEEIEEKIEYKDVQYDSDDEEIDTDKIY